MGSSLGWMFTMTMLCSPFTKKILRFLFTKILLKAGSWITIAALKKLKHKSMNRLGIKMIEKISKQYYDHKNFLDDQVVLISGKISEIMTKKIDSEKMDNVVPKSDFIMLVRLMEQLALNEIPEEEHKLADDILQIGLEMKVQVDKVTGEEIVLIDEVDLIKDFEEINYVLIMSGFNK
jgi:hypothetical protein